MSLPPQYSESYAPCPPARIEDCRDFLRTGRCKYGPSCKYRHPANVQSGGGVRGNSPLEFPIRPDEPPCQYFIKHGTCKFGQSCKFNHPPEARNQRKPDFTPSDAMVMQFLPQRPEEPDCIYFLKNGRCKYGATCRYHHPVHYHQRRDEESRRQMYIQAQDYAKSQQYTLPSNGIKESHLSFYEGRPGVPPDLQPVSVVMAPDGMPYGGQVGSTMPSTDHGSSASSIASSYDTAPVAGDFGDVWSRSRRNGSGGSLAAFVENRPRRMIQSTSENNIAARQHRLRTASLGNESFLQDQYQQQQKMNGSWRNEEPSRPRRLPVSPRARQPRDEGFTMMTSALLTMLDTPEDGPMEGNGQDLRVLSRTAETNGEATVNPALMLERMSLHDTAPEPWTEPWQQPLAHYQTSAHSQSARNDASTDAGMYFP